MPPKPVVGKAPLEVIAVNGTVPHPELATEVLKTPTKARLSGRSYEARCLERQARADRYWLLPARKQRELEAKNALVRLLAAPWR